MKKIIEYKLVNQRWDGVVHYIYKYDDGTMGETYLHYLYSASRDFFKDAQYNENLTYK